MTTDTAPGFALFDTPLGTCGVAWNGHGMLGIQLPEGRRRRHPPPHARPLPARRGGDAPAPGAARDRRPCAR